jgi:hypothetical protein
MAYDYSQAYPNVYEGAFMFRTVLFTLVIITSEFWMPCEPMPESRKP